ncbi:CD276 antigen homolog [Sinocyclocheilus grahami]|uniref:CD276 antigen homolog n=1 Tax=Sinocyclocheilus grahami TaxID=75366 RepID=UPI0007AC725F|nr:PREDICTED: CD276 antigen homolog [Sinocyclocheilus grahami]
MKRRLVHVFELRQYREIVATGNYFCFYRFYFICVSAVLIHKVSLQVPGVIGGSVVLPCSSTEPDQDTEVHWRQNGSKIVYDIIKGKDSVEQQEPRYKNRAETFPEEYKRGNFSIKLNDLQHTDAGKYTCLIAHSSEHKTVELIINEPTTENGTKSADQETQTDVVTSSSLLWVYIIVAVLILIMLIAGFIIGYRKKIQAALFSPVMPEDKEQTEINV